MLVAFCLPAAAQSADSTSSGGPRLEPDPWASFYAENLDETYWRSLFAMAFWAGADDGAERAADSLVPQIKELYEVTVSLDDREKGEAVLEFMHERFFRSYNVKQSSLKTLFDTGSFNCVSSAVLYSILGTAVGLDVSGVNTVDHAFCQVQIDDQQIDVETTNVHGFDPGKKEEFQDGFGRTTGFSYVPPANYRDRVSIDLRGLYALMLQNRIADFEASGQYAEAVGIAVDRWVLLGSGDGAVFEDLIIRMLNYGTKLSRAGREDEALAWAAKGIAAYGTHPKWADFIDGVSNNLLLKLVRAGRFNEARERFYELRPGLTSEAAERLNLMISDSQLLAALDTVKAGGAESEFTSEFTTMLDFMRREGVVPAERITEVELDWRINSMNALAETEGWAAAYDAAGEAIAQMGPLPQLEKARRIYLMNLQAELYNEAVREFNSGRHDEALKLARRAAETFPDEPKFQSLLDSIERAIGGN